MGDQVRKLYALNLKHLKYTIFCTCKVEYNSAFKILKNFPVYNETFLTISVELSDLRFWLGSSCLEIHPWLEYSDLDLFFPLMSATR